MRTMSRILTATMLLVASLLLVAGPASAACHIAAFSSTEATVTEADGQATLLVFLQGRQPSCEGTVDFATEDGTATAGEDYEATSGTLEFVSGDDREEMVVVPILSDDAAEGDETFTITLSNATGGISGSTTPATITITDAGGGDDTEPADAPEDSPAADEGGEADTTTEEGADEGDGGDDGGGSTGLIIAVIVLVVLGGGAAIAFGRRGGRT